MPSGAKKRKAAKKKLEQASSTLKSNNHESRSQDERESDDGVSSQGSYKKAGHDHDEPIEITDSSHDHGKSSSSSSTSSSSSSSSDDESREVEKKDDNKETGDYVSEAITVISVPNQPIPIAGDAPFMGYTANVIVESCGLMDSATPSDPNTEKMIDIAPVENSLPKPNEITPEVSLASDEVKRASSSVTDTDVKENEGKTSTLPESNSVPESSKESEVVISHEEEAPMRPTHGVAQRTSWLSCCGLFDVMTGSSR